MPKRDSCRLRPEIEGADDLLVAVAASEGDRVAVGREKGDLALGESRMGFAEVEKAAVVLQNGSRVAFLAVNREIQMLAGARAATASRARSRHSPHPPPRPWACGNRRGP